eukprot:15457369-Alexandrium_andersonii.AAC.1
MGSSVVVGKGTAWPLGRPNDAIGLEPLLVEADGGLGGPPAQGRPSSAARSARRDSVAQRVVGLQRPRLVTVKA